MSSGGGSPTECVVFFTHRWDERIARHFARLKREAGGTLAVYLAYQLGEGRTVPAGIVPDVVVTDALAAATFPGRYAAGRRRRTMFGYLDVFWLTAFLQPPVAAFDRVWFMEYDVDFSGDWSRFFARALNYPDDIVAAHLRWRRDQPDWNWLRTVVDPLERSDDHLIGYFPISRFTRRAIDTVAAAYRRGGWDGHFELVIPTVANRAGLLVADLGGTGSLTPPGRRDVHYRGDFRSLHRGFYTYNFGPPMQHYFVESRLGFWSPNRLYHPVKIGLIGRKAAIAWWVKFRDRTRAALAHLAGGKPRVRGQR